MKKILIAALAMTLLSGSAFAAGGKKKAKAKKAKANTECCSKATKNCKPTADCPVIPGCCKQ